MRSQGLSVPSLGGACEHGSPPIVSHERGAYPGPHSVLLGAGAQGDSGSRTGDSQPTCGEEGSTL